LLVVHEQYIFFESIKSFRILVLFVLALRALGEGSQQLSIDAMLILYTVGLGQ
jgi:hypothetical protein